MAQVVELIRKQRVIALLGGADPGTVIAGARAAAEGGVQLLAVPASIPQVADIVAELVEAELHVGIAGVTDPAQIALALAIDASFVISPVCDPDLVRAAFERGLPCIAGAATPNELHAATRVPADFVQLFPVNAFGGLAYFTAMRRQFPTLPLVVCGGVDMDSGPNYLEAGAHAIIVDRGLLPDRVEAEAMSIITTRAAALVEVVADIQAGKPSRPPPSR